MRYYLDTEFIEDGETINLISIGLVCEDGRELYLLNWECDFTKASLWVQNNVLAQLPEKNRRNLASSVNHMFGKYTSKKRISIEVFNFCNPEIYGKPEFWAYYADYDWVVFCQLFGTMMDLPKGFPMYCRDIKQLCDQLGNPRLPEQKEGNHNALSDAKHNKVMWEFLNNLST